MTTELEKTSQPSISTEPLFNDVNINTTSSWHDNVTEAFQVPEGCLVVPFSTVTPWDHPDDLVSRETRQHFVYFVDVYFLSLCFLISVPTNVINMAVFWKHGIKERINLCLFCLSFDDIGTLVCYFLIKADRIYAAISKTVYKGVLLKFFIKHNTTLVGFIYVSGFLSTLVAFERCLCVVSPLKAQSMIPTKTTAAIIAIGHVIIFSGTYFILVKFSMICLFDPLTGESMEVLAPSEFSVNNRELVDFFVGIVYGILLPGTFTAGVSISTVVTIVKLRRMAEWREQSSSSASLPRGDTTVKDMTLTRMLIGTSCVFVGLLTPQLLFYAAVPFVPELGLNRKYNNTFYFLMTLQQMCVYTNSSVNFFVYYSFGTRYRQTVRGMFCGWRRTRNRARMTTETKVSTDTAVSSVSQ